MRPTRRYQAFWLSLLVGMSPGVFVGCTTYETPDGYSFSSASGTERVQNKLGKPDMIEEEDRYMWGPYHFTAYTYLDRGYRVDFSNRSVRGVYVITGDDRAEYQERVRAYKEEVPKVRLGGVGQEVVETFGPPDHVEVQRVEDGMTYGTYSGPYRAQFDQSPPAEKVLAYWRKDGILVILTNGRVTKVRPLTGWDRRNVLGEGPSEDLSPRVPAGR